MAESRPKRWAKACTKAREELDKVTSALEGLNAAREELASIQEEYQEWKDGLPDNLQSSSLADKLETVTSLDLSSDAEIEVEWLDEAEGIDLPLGFGRD